MPYKVKGKCVYKKDGGAKVGCTKGSVEKYLGALHANANESEDKSLNEIRRLVRKTLSESVETNLNDNFWKWFAGSKVVDSSGNPLPVHHGTAKKFSKFSFKNALQKIVWFTSNKSSIEAGEVGAAGKGHIMDLYVSMKNPAGWDEYEKYGLGQLREMGYDGAILPDPDGTFTGFAFEPTQLKSVLNKGEWDSSNKSIYKEEEGFIEESDLRRIKLFVRKKLLESVSKLKPNQYSKPYRFYMLCDKLCNIEGVEVKNQMILDASPISRKTFEKNCAYANELFKFESQMADDPSHGFYKSKVKGVPCLYMQYAGFEFIFLKDYKGGKEYWLDELNEVTNFVKKTLNEMTNSGGERYQLLAYSDDYNEDFEEYGLDEYEVSERAHEIAKNGGVTILRDKNLNSVLVDLKEKKVIGGLWVSQDHDKFSFDIALDSTYQNMGLSSNLIKQAISEYEMQKEMYGDDLVMEVDVINPKLAEILKNKYGFYKVGDLGPNRVLMSLNESQELSEDYPSHFDMEHFKSLKTFAQRIQYCDANLKRIGGGSSRIVFKIDDQKVLKLAKNKKGIVQNDTEIDRGNDTYYSSILAQVFDSDDDGLWVEMELATPINKYEFYRLTNFDLKDVGNYLINFQSETNGRGTVVHQQKPLVDRLVNDEFVQLLRDFVAGTDALAGDLGVATSYGLVKRNGQQELVIIDFGLTDRAYEKLYRESTINEDNGRELGKSLSNQINTPFVTIYRAAPMSANTFFDKDYVTLSKKFAIEHAENNHVYHEEPYHVIEALVSTKDVYDAYNPGEYFYSGPDKKAREIYVSLGPDEYEGLDEGQTFSDDYDLSKHNFNHGDCDIYAVSLHRLYGYPLYVVRGWFLEPEWGGERGYDYEDSHIIVKLPNGNYMDSDGETTESDLRQNCAFGNDIEKITFEPVSEEEALSTFSCENQEPAIKQVMNYINLKNDLRKYIGKTLRESLLNERLTNVDDDVNLLYVKYFEYDVNELERTGRITDTMFLQTEINTAILKSEDCVKANKTNSCIIKINTGSNGYQPSSRIITIGVNSNAINFIKNDAKGSIKLAVNMLTDVNQQNSLSREFNEEKIKGSIHHELAHWIDDTLNNQHINKRLNKAMEVGTKDLGGIPVNATKMEIQGQIHNIKQLHNKYSNFWNTLTFDEMISFSPPLSTIFKGLKGDIKTKWIRNLKTRMHREGLLGKLMS